MRDQRKHFPVNWVDGMKINKSHFIDQDNAWSDALHEQASLNLSGIRYGILPPSAAGEKTFDISISSDGQNSIRVLIHSCQAITAGGVRISLPDATIANSKGLESTFPIYLANKDSAAWIFLFVNPFEKQAAGSPDFAENPPRYPNVWPTYSIKIINDGDYRQYDNHPYGIPVGRITISGNDINVDERYIPPCLSLKSHPDLDSLYGKLNTFLINMESYCSGIVQNFSKKKPLNEISKNETSDLIVFLADRMMICLAQSITSMKWTIPFDPPAMMFATASTLARVMLNTINIGVGKEKLLNYLASWSKARVQPGTIQNVLESMVNGDFSNNDIDKHRRSLLDFMEIMAPLFSELSKQEFDDEKNKPKVVLR